MNSNLFQVLYWSLILIMLNSMFEWNRDKWFGWLINCYSISIIFSRNDKKYITLFHSPIIWIDLFCVVITFVMLWKAVKNWNKKLLNIWDIFIVTSHNKKLKVHVMYRLRPYFYCISLSLTHSHTHTHTFYHESFRIQI